jgi:hypothetical protein
MKNLTIEQKYLILLDGNKKTSHFLKFFPYSKGGEFFKMFLIILFASFIESIFPTFYITLILSFIICINYYHLYNFRTELICFYVVQESYMNLEYQNNGIDINFPYDPLYVTDDERGDLFEDHLRSQKNKDILQKIKDYYIFSMIIVLSYFLLYFLIRHSINYHLIP